MYIILCYVFSQKLRVFVKDCSRSVLCVSTLALLEAEFRIIAQTISGTAAKNTLPSSIFVCIFIVNTSSMIWNGTLSLKEVDYSGFSQAGKTF